MEIIYFVCLFCATCDLITFIIQELCLEKELRLKESMKMMGLANWVHWLAWFVKNFLFLSITTLLIVILCKVRPWG